MTFYGLPTAEAFSRWAESVPEGFRFVLKGSRFITHIKRLSGCEDPLGQLSLRLIGAVLQEQHEEWMASRRYFSQESMAKLYAARQRTMGVKARASHSCLTSRRDG